MNHRPLFAFLIAASLLHAQPASGATKVGGIAATVNGRVITENQINFSLAPYAMQLMAQYPRRGPEFERLLNEAREKLLAEMIDREIILDEFKAMGATLKPQVVEEEINRQIRERFNGKRQTLLEELKKNRMTLESYREMTRDKLAVQAMRAQHFSDAPPPLPNEIQREYAELKSTIRDQTKDVITFQMIFIPRIDTETQSDADAQLAIAEDVFAQLKDGKDFAELAKQYSKDAFAEAGGTREKVVRPDLSPAFASILFDAEPGKLIGPLEDPAGFSIVKVISKELGPSRPLSDPEIRDMVEESVRRKKTSGSYDKWIAGKRKSAIIVRK
jgi:peptidyl-prolyl cis-trans isomerase SurA